MKTSSKASAAKKKQKGDYFDSNFSYSITLNKLNQKMEKVLYKEIQRTYSNAKEIIGSL